jgi:predicted esterase
MKKIAIVFRIVALMLVLIGPLAGQGQERKVYGFADYQAMRQRVIELYNQKDFAEALNVLRWAWEAYPEKSVANAFNLALVHGQLGEFAQGVQALQAALDKGQFFGLWQFTAAIWAPYQERPEFQAFLERNKGLAAQAQKKAVLQVDVSLPEGYDKSRPYPLFIALHGGGENLAEFKPQWTSPRLRREFLVAYVQSTQVASMTGFHWQDAAATARDLAEALARVRSAHLLDEKKIFVGGFSSGGYGSLVALLDDVLPARGFVILCPPVPEPAFEAKVPGLKARGIRGAFMTTERDQRLDEQKRWHGIFVQAGLDVEFSVAPDTGHWYPDDFAARLDAALERMLK